MEAEEYDVVVNHEEQYSIWPTHLRLPDGWRAVGFRGDKEACLEHVREVWVDMRPLSLRRRLAGPKATAHATETKSSSRG